ncbi:MAG: glycosyltransferase family 4 protein [Chthoniobacterales bacterium]|nr:glycosyltransferase family 4 protein [Chthoniobacterales bacterium]
MKILISSHAFAPSIGGIETVTALLAREFVRAGHDVILVTQTAEQNQDEYPFRVIRRPSLGELMRALHWCDVFWQNNLSLRTIWPALLQRIPVVITHQGSYCRRPSGIDLVQRVKRAVVQRKISVAISAAVAACFDQPSIVIANPFDAGLFRSGPTPTERPNDLVFLGRLVSEKGVDVLLRALAQLPGVGLTIIGLGPETFSLQALTKNLGLDERVSFVGAKRDADLVASLQEHKILVVPSLYDEPFGVVALEGIACGCVVVGSSGGGLPEAIGPCGVTFPNGDVAALAAALARLLTEPNERTRLAANGPQHLARFHPAVIARAYLDLFADQLR